jgi:DNA-binding SARP family transcriptional activator
VLSVRLLGSPEVLLDARLLNLPRRKTRALVYYLAAHPRPLTRDHLLGLFWPDLERAAAQHTLRTTLHSLRKSLGPAFVVEEDSLSLAPDVEVDARLFESNLQLPVTNLQSLIATLDLYRADFLDGFSLPDTPSFDDWAAAERERYRRLAVRGWSALGQQHEAQQNYRAALDALDRALAFDPLQEDVQRAALRLHYLSGDRAGAIRRYETLRKLLDAEMAVPPMAETRALYDAIITDQLPVTPPQRQPPVSISQSPLAPAPLPFTGRASELHTLSALAASRKLALIEGEPGIGKTRLVEEYLRASGAMTLIGRGRELEQALPYQPVVEALRTLLDRADWPTLHAGLRGNVSPLWLNEIARLLPELSPANLQSPMTHYPSAADEPRLWEGTHQFLAALSRHHPVALFLDDLHWADDSTLALLGYLARRARAEAASAPITFLATARPTAPRSPLAALLQALTREGCLERLPLSRLAPKDITALARHLSPTYAPPLAEWLNRAAEGNPYILTELVRHARENGILLPDGTLNLVELPASPVVPQTVYALIQSRLDRLSEAARRVLDAAVPVGREFEFAVVARASALSETAALDALDELRAAGLVYQVGLDVRYTFDHSLTMEVAYREVGEARHRLLHRRVAEALEGLYRNQTDAVAGLLAQHFAEGNAPERAAPYAFRAGQLAAGLAAWAEAIGFYELALTGELDDGRRAAILIALGEARGQAGEWVRATEAFREALALGQVHKAVNVPAAQFGLGESLLMQARYGEAIELAQSLSADATHATRARVEALWGTALSLEGTDLARAADHLQEAAALLRDESAPVDAAQLAQIIFELGNVAAQQGDLPKAIALYQESLDIAGSAESEASLPQRILAYNNLAYHRHLLDPQDPQALEHAHLGLRLAQETGALGLQTYLLSTLGEIALAQGDPDAAEKYFADGLALAERLTIPERIAGLTANLGRVAVRRGETPLAIHRLSTALTRADAVGTHHLAAQIRLWLVPLLPPAEARARLAEARAIAESGGRRRLLTDIARLEAGLPPA